MKQNARKLMAMIMVLAMLASMFAVASGEQEVIDLGDGIVIDEGTGIDGGSDDGTGTAGESQDEEGELEIEMDEGEGLPDGTIDPEGGEDLNLGLDLNSAALEGNEEELAPVTEEAMMAGGTSESDAIEIGTWQDLSRILAAATDNDKRSDGEGEGKPTHYKLKNDVTPSGDIKEIPRN